jgi:acyl-CoA synthetase (AMP-forming)/AMP-acid ligase II
LLQHADQLWNVYGPTETTIWSTIEPVRSGPGPVSLGRPIANTRIAVVDDQGEPVPWGVSGEIWIGGAGVARGYRNRPELTAERFVSSAFDPGERIYRTGDLGRWRRDGALEHLGRLDFQVKIHGFRIEVHEIEGALEAIPEIRQAVVMAHGEGDDRRLVAYCVFEAGTTPTATEIRQALRRTLPAYMIPGLVVPMDAFPLTANGKVDRKALPNPLAQAHKPTREWEAPATPAEVQIAGIWCALLGVERVGRHDNFFELGGHSLLSIRAVAAIDAQLGRRVDPRTFFFSTLSQIAAAVAGAGE